MKNKKEEINATDAYFKHKMERVEMWREIRECTWIGLKIVGGIALTALLLVCVIDWAARQFDRLKKIDSLEIKVHEHEDQIFNIAMNVSKIKPNMFDYDVLVARVDKLEQNSRREVEVPSWGGWRITNYASPLILTNVGPRIFYFTNSGTLATNTFINILTISNAVGL